MSEFAFGLLVGGAPALGLLGLLRASVRRGAAAEKRAAEAEGRLVAYRASLSAQLHKARLAELELEGAGKLAETCQTLARLAHEEAAAARAINLPLADRVYLQHELLGRRAERPPPLITETDYALEG